VEYAQELQPMHDDTHVPPSQNMYTSCVVVCVSAAFSSSSYAAPEDMAPLLGRVGSWSTAKHGVFLQHWIDSFFQFKF
jgi:hypothetical protein